MPHDAVLFNTIEENTTQLGAIYDADAELPPAD